MATELRGMIIGLDALWVATAHGQGLVEIGFELMTHEGDDDARDCSSSLKADIVPTRDI